MRKFRIILCALCSALCIIPAGCGGTVDLASGAEVRLTVETSAQEFTVTSSFGRVEGKDRSYTVRVERKRDFLITVSAPGYETCNVPVLTADLASGSCEKTARLTEEKKITVTLRVAGAQGQVTAACGGLPLTQRGLTTFTGKFSETQLTQGVDVNAEGSEPLTADFGSLSGDYRYLEVRLIPQGKRLVEFAGLPHTGYVITDAEGNIFSTAENYDSTLRKYVASAILDGEFSGEVCLLYPYDREIVARGTVRADSGAYGNRIRLYMRGDHGVTVTGVPEEEGYFGNFYLQRENGFLEWINGSYIQDWGHVALNDLPEETADGVLRLWMKDVAGGFRRTEVPLDREEIAFSAFEPVGLTADAGVICNHYFYDRMNLAEIRVEDDGGTETVPLKSGIFDWKAEWESPRIYAGDTEAWLSNGYYFAEGRLCHAAVLSEPNAFRLALTYDGEPLTGAEITAPETGNSFSEVRPGVYESDSFGDTLKIVQGGVTRYLGTSGVTYADWTREEDGGYLLEKEVSDWLGAQVYVFGAYNAKIEADPEQVRVFSLSGNENFYLYVNTACPEIELRVTGFVRDWEGTEHEETAVFRINVEELALWRGIWHLEWENGAAE